MDREKVISAYECVITRGKSVCECGKCDYHIKDSAVFFCDNQRVLTDALALLKEHEDLGKELESAIELIHKKNERIEKLLIEQENASKRNPVIVCPHCGKRVK